MAVRKSSEETALREEAARLDEEREAQKQHRIKAAHLLKMHQPVVYRILDQAVRSGDISHAYLFQGPKGCLKSEAAMLFSQSIFLNRGGLVDEAELDGQDAVDAERIAGRNYGDFLFVNGYRKEAISRDETTAIQSLFSRTTIEKSDRKVYVLDHAENSSIGAMNSLLKFLEEPADNVYAILTTDNPERLLPTIISRCVVIPFRPLAPEVYAQLMAEDGLDEEDIFLLSRIVDATSGFADQAAGRTYQTAKQMLKQAVGAEGNPDLLLVDYEVRYRLKQKDLGTEDKGTAARDANLDVLLMFFGMLGAFYKDVIRGNKAGPAWYSDAVKNAMRHTDADYPEMAAVCIEQRDLCNRNNDLNLLMAQAVYRLEAAKHGQ